MAPQLLQFIPLFNQLITNLIPNQINRQVLLIHSRSCIIVGNVLEPNPLRMHFFFKYAIGKNILQNFREQTITGSVVELVNEVLPSKNSHLPPFEPIYWVKIQKYPSGGIHKFILCILISIN